MAESKTLPAVAAHGAARLPSVEVDSYNVELKDDEGFLGDRASKSAFTDIIDNWRKALRKTGGDPFGDIPTADLSKKQLDELLTKGDPEAAGLVHGAIEEFAQELALVIRRFLKQKAWAGTERIVVGGGFRAHRVGELAIGRAGVILKADKIKVDLVPIRNDPDEAGLLGAAHLAPAWMFKAHDAIIGVDIGGTNMRAGIVDLNLKKNKDLSKASVWKYELWRHADEDDVKREDAVKNLAGMLDRLIAKAQREKIKLAPFIGIGCPGMIEPDGSIDRGAQNLPGNWTSSRFNLPKAIHEAIPKIGDDETAIVLHNDAVVQGLSETPFMQDVDHWAVLTIGTGLGNARFTNRNGE
ncbi:ROK family protein [Pseudorhodoplanes sp.]|uniref:ROK family protein n=1 Tax=Pseudorhodoplanes sp. TaxID=1934341 RepID=UPI002B80FDAB|nr:ROK family protein [Pseudorhodoplanes sp.]HWV54547.1 ROK family protein [Pseudorhodoplanes sp.]